MDNKKKTISDYEKRLMEDRAMLDELVEENYMSGSEMIKNQLKHFRQELDYMENQLYFIKYEMREQKVTEVTVKNNIEEEVVQKESIQVKNEDIVQTADEVKDRVIATQSVKSNSEDSIVKLKNGAKDLEKMVGKSLMGIFASILVFISLILFATIILPYFNDIAKMICTYLVSFVFLGFGLYKGNKEPDTKFFLALLGCGVGALYISLILSNFYFKVIGDIPLYILIALWGIGVCYLAKYKNQIFQIIGLCGITISLIFGCNLCVETNDVIKFIALIVFYVLSYGIFYYTHFSKKFYENLTQNIFGFVNVAYLYITSSEISSEGIDIVKVVILVIIAINIGLALYTKIDDAKYSFAIILLSFILLFMLELYNIIPSKEVYGIVAWLICVVLIGIIEWKEYCFEIGKTIITSVLAIMSLCVLSNNELVLEHGFVPMIVLPLILLGFYRKNDMYKILSLLMLSMYVFSYDIEIMERAIFGLIVLGTTFGLMCRKKDDYTVIFTAVYHLFTLVFLYYAPYQVFAVELTDKNVGNMLGFILSNAFNITMMLINFYANDGSEEDSRIIYKLINMVMMIVGLVLIGKQLGIVTHFIIILTTVVVFMLNVKNILDKYDGLFSGVYIGGKFTVLLIVILASFDAPNYIVSIGCFVISIMSIMCGFKGKYKSLRIYGLILSMISIFKLIMIDINYENTLGNALSFLGSGILCFVINMIYNYIDKKFTEKE